MINRKMKKNINEVRKNRKSIKKVGLNTKTKGFKMFYADAFRYLKESQNFVYWIIIMFFLSALIGFTFHEQFSVLDDTLRRIAESVEGLNGYQLVLFIFVNNVQASLIGFIFGPLLGIAPVLNALSNGAILGYVSYLAISARGPLVLLNLVPHGIFELPAIFISLGMGLRWATFIFAPKKKVKERFMYYFRNGFKVFFGIVIPLLAIRAVIEGVLIAIAT